MLCSTLRSSHMSMAPLLSSSNLSKASRTLPISAAESGGSDCDMRVSAWVCAPAEEAAPAPAAAAGAAPGPAADAGHEGARLLSLGRHAIIYMNNMYEAEVM